MADLIALSLFAASLSTGGLVLVAHQLSPHFPALHLPLVPTSTYGVPLSPVLRLLLAPVIFVFLLPALGTALGRYFSFGTAARRKQLISNSESEERAGSGNQPFDEEWELRLVEEQKRREDPKVRATEYEGVIGLFHPFCNAGGGGERVLWAAIRATQKKYPRAVCVVYTGDHDVSKNEMASRAAKQFNIQINESRVQFLYLSTRSLVLPNTWPRFTLLGQSIGSLIMLVDAFTLLVPDMFIDTMGYGFSLALAKWLKPDMPTGAYVHYPTISTDMLATLDDEPEPSATTDGTGLLEADPKRIMGRRGVNAGAGKGLRGAVKRSYWQWFAWMYSRAGGSVDVVMTNATWTQGHIRVLWGKSREKQGRKSEIEVVFPPCPVDELEKAVKVDEASEKKREKALLYVAQFRPEKNHELILHAFAEMLRGAGKGGKGSDQSIKASRLVLAGSVREDSDDDKKRVYKLRLLANELGIARQVEFLTNAPWTRILELLGSCSIGVNGMWNEHFGIGVVEYQAAGLICVVNNSGGPKLDIVVPIDGKPTGFHASSVAEYADGFRKALQMGPEEALATRRRARESARRFTEEEFVKRWLIQLDKLILLDVYRQPLPLRPLQILISALLAVTVTDDVSALFGPAIKSLIARYF